MRHSTFLVRVLAILLICVSNAFGEELSSDQLFWEAEVAKCWSCGASGLKPCGHCGSPEESRFTCNHCDRIQKQARACPVCKGVNLVNRACPDCGGIDLLATACKQCNGTGRLNQRPCIFCSGTGKRGPCFTCNGRGRQDPCGACNGTGRPPGCPGCEGEEASDVQCGGCAAQAPMCRNCFGAKKVYVVVAAHQSLEELVAGVRKRRAAAPIAGAPPGTLTLKGSGSNARVVAEDGSFHGELNERTQRHKVVFVHGYLLEDGRYVKSHFQELPSLLPGKEVLVPTVVFDRRKQEERSHTAP